MSPRPQASPPQATLASHHAPSSFLTASFGLPGLKERSRRDTDASEMSDCSEATWHTAADRASTGFEPAPLATAPLLLNRLRSRAPCDCAAAAVAAESRSIAEGRVFDS